MSVRPAIVSVPVRAVVEGLAATLYVTHDVPLPADAPGNVIHGLSLDADHPHDAVVLTNALFNPPEALIDALDGDTL